MNTSLTENIYQDLNKYLKENSRYVPTVVKKSLKQSNKFPLVTLIEENNSFSSGTLKYKARETTDSLYWEINIYAQDKALGKKMISNAVICDELKVLVDDIMSKKYKLTRLSCRPTPNLDDTIYRITMRYTGDLFTNKNRII